MFINVIVIVIAEGEIKNFKGEGVIYMIFIASKYGILLELREL